MAETWQAAAVETESEGELELETQEIHEEAAADSRPFTMSSDDFAALEERVVRAVGVVKQERQARALAEERVAQAESELRAQSERLEQSESEVSTLRAERDHVRQRVEKLLQQLDELEL